MTHIPGVDNRYRGVATTHGGSGSGISPKNERGAALVEFALILPLFMMLVLGMFSGGLAYNTQIALRNAAREGARYGSILPQTPESVSGASWAQRIQANVVARSEGELTTNDICVALVDGGSGTVVTPSVTAGAFTTEAGGGNCFDDGGADGKKRVQVRVGANATIEALVFSYDVGLSSKSVARFEPPSSS
jgi:Flp pilus assembly protein TadG